MSQFYLSVVCTNPCLQWKRLSEVLPETRWAKGKADGMTHVAAGHIMNDDLESAEAGLANGTSSFHKVCQSFLPGCLRSRLIALDVKDAG